MYRKNDEHRQLPLISDLNRLPDKLQIRLEESWAGTFYRAFFARLKEEPFAVLYSEQASRPNVPVNVLVGLEVLKAGFGWSDEELYDAFSYDLQVRYALGYRNLDEGHFELRTVYNFRRRLSAHMQATGENLLEAAFEQVTDEQLQALKVKTSHLRMDSTQVASNIRQMSRLQLLVEMLQRLVRVMTDAEQARYADELAPYLKGSSGQYVYRVKPEEVNDRLQEVGELMQRLVADLAAAYAENETYQLFKRVFGEHFVEETEAVRPKQGKEELPGSTLHSPDDPEATYRKAKGKEHIGYVANVAETCHPDNKVQLVVSVQVADNCQDDARLLADILPDLHARTGFEKLHTDGNYSNPDVDELLRERQATLVQTRIRGGQPDPARLGFDQFLWERDEKGWPTHLTCPHGQRVPVIRHTDTHFLAYFDQTLCQQCPLLTACRTRPMKSNPLRRLAFKKRTFYSALRQQARQAQIATGHNPRAAVEATVRSLKHPFPNGKLPVRGQNRMAMMLVASATMTNVRRIWRYERQQEEEKRRAGWAFRSFFTPFRVFVAGILTSWVNPAPVAA
jgi:hypothetical protein